MLMFISSLIELIFHFTEYQEMININATQHANLQKSFVDVSTKQWQSCWPLTGIEAGLLTTTTSSSICTMVIGWLVTGTSCLQHTLSHTSPTVRVKEKKDRDRGFVLIILRNVYLQLA